MMWKKVEYYLRDISLNLRRERELNLNRRGFITAALGLLAVMFISSFPLAAKAFRKLPADKIKRFRIAGPDELGVGESKGFTYPDEHEPAILVRLSANEYRSYLIKCTHLQCPVYWDQRSGKLTCPCHNGYFAVEDGSVLAGPPQRPLSAIALEFRKDGIYAIGVHKGA